MNTMTANEVIERSRETTEVLGRTYSALQSELLTPLVNRAVKIIEDQGYVD